MKHTLSLTLLSMVLALSIAQATTLPMSLATTELKVEGKGSLETLQNNLIQDKLLLKSVTREDGYRNMTNYLLTLPVDSTITVQNLAQQYPNLGELIPQFVKSNAVFSSIAFSSYTTATLTCYLDNVKFAKLVAPFYTTYLHEQQKMKMKAAKVAKVKEKKPVVFEKALELSNSPDYLFAVSTVSVTWDETKSNEFNMSRALNLARNETAADFSRQLTDLPYRKGMTFAQALEKHPQMNHRDWMISDYQNFQVKDQMFILKSRLNLKAMKQTLVFQDVQNLRELK